MQNKQVHAYFHLQSRRGCELGDDIGAVEATVSAISQAHETHAPHSQFQAVHPHIRDPHQTWTLRHYGERLHRDLWSLRKYKD